ncbi:hypothetical protein PHG01_00574 [Streptococcus mutans PKUSS-HG01]|nr:hypothetical protein PHG01_00574 [Streptococcus mutans PKUSS-HG01]
MQSRLCSFILPQILMIARKVLKIQEIIFENILKIQKLSV